MKKKSNAIKIAIILIIVLIAVGCALLFKLRYEDTSSSVNAENTSIEVKSTDSTPPEIKILSEKQIIATGEKVKIQATAKDETDGDLTGKITTNEIDTTTPGEYEITYKVKDEAGNEASKTQKLIVREELKNGLPVAMYHFFYDNEKYWKQDNNWLNIQDFEAQLKYLTENDFYFPTWEEVEQYIDGTIKLPSKSVVLTADDGDDSFFDLAVPLMQKYKVPVTSFVVTDWYGHRYNKDLEYVVWESHSASMHQSGGNGKGRMVNLSYDEILKDLKTSSEVLGNCTVFCYPFGHYNDTAISALKDSPFKLAFTVEGGRVYPGMNKFLLPRVRVSDGNSLNYYIQTIS